MALYQLRQDADGIVLVFNFAGEQVIKLEGGAAELIVMTYQNMSQFDHRGDDYMAGIIQGIIHCMMLAPTAFSPLPSIPSIGPSEENAPAVFNRPECPFHYCDQPTPHEACEHRCRHRPQ